MDNLLLNAEHIDLSGNDILKITDNKCKIMTYEELQDKNNIDDVFGGFNSVALLYETKMNFGHWVALLRYADDTIEFFDPYALSIDEELKYAHYNVRITENGLMEPHLSYLLNKSDKNILLNKVRVQKWIHDVNTCGRHIALRIKFKNTPLERYLSYITQNKYYNPDLWVTALTITYTMK